MAHSICKLHRDGTVTYPSPVTGQMVWKTTHVPAADLQALPPADRRRITHHLHKNLQRFLPECSPKTPDDQTTPVDLEEKYS